jgi:predicted NAD-dependent protein-ADP-ribosyltransferase YbiA (DUF1768 family)
MWNTIEHAYIAKKIKRTNKILYNLLSLDSNSFISKINGRSVLDLKQVMNCRKKFRRGWFRIRHKVKKKIYKAKFKQHQIAREALILTYYAQLFHKDDYGKIIRMKSLENIRFELIKEFLIEKTEKK